MPEIFPTQVSKSSTYFVSANIMCLDLGFSIYSSRVPRMGVDALSWEGQEHVAAALQHIKTDRKRLNALEMVRT
jgi:hypothetical protein